MSRFRWPVQFGLLNNDCLWVMDEIQLMGSGLATSVQLQAFRKAMGTVFPVRSVWMSATMHKEWLDTVDFQPSIDELQEITLSDEDRAKETVLKRIGAKKKIRQASCSWDNPKQIAGVILETHRKGTLTLVVVNTVNRATEIYSEIKKTDPEADLILVHSRYRPSDRSAALDRLLTPPGKKGAICVTTQVIEAGVDLSTSTLFTDLAPWPSLVQRFGRCNRYGEDSRARIYWFDIDLDKKGTTAPYSVNELLEARGIISRLTDGSPGHLPAVSSTLNHTQVIRSKDIVDLFDTTPDLAGLDLDISRYIREQEENDVFIFWRNFLETKPDDSEPAPDRNELCSIPIGEAKQSKFEFWRWDHLEKRWSRAWDISPGMVLMTRKDAGGYSPEMDWTGIRDDKPEILDLSRKIEEGDDDDFYVLQSLLEHTSLVCKELEGILSSCGLIESEWSKILIQAALWHDFGKSHEVFQKALGDEKASGEILAKFPLKGITYERKGFRHELASALAVLEEGLPDLIAYLVAAHHGKVRLSIRSLPHETKPQDPTKRFARGIWDGDMLPEVRLENNQVLPRTIMDLTYMEFGEGLKGASWLERMLKLREDTTLGPFRLAYLEALVRAADWRASQKSGN